MVRKPRFVLAEFYGDTKLSYGYGDTKVLLAGVLSTLLARKWLAKITLDYA